ncbi:SDR family oxidoreductase [Paenibacillus sp. NEAU-GSW1]|uniref:SDR family oxidoreductase n=1 Tax=Paenibacillus sp. NEAU-GSW1 TaxID=2682486 RepID=UPI0012E137DF|nr:SDR family oxidoreductase [Paenibacillus sp. NEAU-GSW1]MUT65957.1 NAD(P)H-binding protein [Paenibacillus sp. NEAU-GSW1]
MKVLVTGATGNLGALVVEGLIKVMPVEQIAVSVRDPKKAEKLSGVGIDVRYGNFNEPESLVKAFEGIDRLLIISSGDLQGRDQQHINAIKAAKEAGVQFIAYTSAPNAQESNLFVAPDHRVTENELQASGIPFTILRNNWYLENEIGTFQAVLNGAPWVTSAGTGKVGWVARRDFAEAAVKVLTSQGHDNKVYELSGKPLTQQELVTIFNQAVNKEVQVLQVDDNTYGKMMSDAGVPEMFIPFLVSTQSGIRDGELDIESDDLVEILGRPATPLDEVIKQILN